MNMNKEKWNCIRIPNEATYTHYYPEYYIHPVEYTSLKVEDAVVVKAAVYEDVKNS